jgi:sigma-B regulation protein RsbU (phosphoserine phosphatase)
MSRDKERLAAVRRYTSLDAPLDGAFQRTARMAAKIFPTPMATVSIVDEDRVWFLATTGLDGVTQIGAEPGLCASAIAGSEPYVVNEAASDPRTAEHPLVVGDLAVRFYAAAPILTSDGHALGTVNVLDVERHRRVTATQTSLLADLADAVAEVMEIRLTTLTTLRTERAGRAQESSPSRQRRPAPRADESGRPGAGRPPPSAMLPTRWRHPLSEAGRDEGC